MSITQMIWEFVQRLFAAFAWDTDRDRFCGCNAVVACMKHSKIYDDIDQELDARGQ